MRQPAIRPLPPASQRVLAITARHWGLRVMRDAEAAAPACAPAPSVMRVPIDDSQPWPYWPAYPAAAVGWR